MNEFIYEKSGSLSNETCQDIIEYFEKNTHLQHNGMVSNKQNKGLYNKKIKNTKDITILVKEINNAHTFYPFYQTLLKELVINLNKYLSNMQNLNIQISQHNISIEMFLMHKYKQNEGSFSYHTDFATSDDFNKYRLINFLWYLNDVESGGETEFFGSYNIKPEAGKLVFFPSEWFFPHSGKMPLSNDKYVIAGWFYIDCYGSYEI